MSKIKIGDFNLLPAARPDEAPRLAGIIVPGVGGHSPLTIQQFFVTVGGGGGLNYAITKFKKNHLISDNSEKWKNPLIISQ